MKYEIISNYRTNDALRQSFNRLATEVFGLSFETWYRNGFWNDKYIPYSIVINGEVISNVSVNIINCEVCGEPRYYIQLGTVMTSEKYRHQGYSRLLMEKIMSDYPDVDGIFLYANDEVVDFYPKFGFRKADEYRFRTAVSTNKSESAVMIPMNNAEDFASFLERKRSLRSFSPVITDTDDLLMFYLTQFMQECVYTAEGCIIIAEKDGDMLTVYDILSDKQVDPTEICGCFGSEIKKAEFAFIPENSYELEKYLYHEDDTTFFVMGERLIADLPKILSFPALVHA